MALADEISARVAATRRRLVAGGLLQPVEWGVPTDEPVRRGRRTFTYSTLDALIEERTALARSRYTTERADNIMLTILDPVAITDEHLFRWGDPPDTYSVKAVEGLLKDEETGVRFASEVTVIR